MATFTRSRSPSRRWPFGYQAKAGKTPSAIEVLEKIANHLKGIDDSLKKIAKIQQERG
jgi:hypothetical protein